MKICWVEDEGIAGTDADCAPVPTGNSTPIEDHYFVPHMLPSRC